MVRGFGPMAMFSAMTLNRAPASARRPSRLGSLGSWCSNLFKLSMRRACWRAALKRASSHSSAERPWAVRSRLRASKSWRSESFLCSCACVRVEKERRNAAAKRNMKFLMPMKLAADADSAETENHVAAGRGTAEAQHGAEAGEKQHLVKLAPEFQAVWAGENLVIGHVALCVDGNVQKKTVRQGKFEVVLLRCPGLRIVRKRDQFGGAHQIECYVVLDGAHGDARHDHLEHQHENEDGREESACGWKGQRAENIVEENFGAILHAAHSARPVLRMLRLSGSNLDAHGEIGRRNIFGDTRKHHGQLAEALQFLAANAATFQVLPNLDTLFNARSARYRIIEITGQFGSYCVALHWTPLPAELARGDTPSEETVTRRAAENASPKGDGRASETLPCEDVCTRFAGTGGAPKSGSRIPFSARRPRRMRDFTVPTLHSRTS